MAKSLNRSRIRQTQLVLVFSVVCILFSRPWVVQDSPLDNLMDMFGNALVLICVLGRLYCTSFIGGKKNTTLVTTGPFSLCRNPLYFSSFLGACGIGLMSNHLVLSILLPVFFCLVYFPLIRREEGYLKEHFGQDFLSYAAMTPRFVPAFTQYQSDESISVNIRFMHKALKDSILWLCALPFFELVEYLHGADIIHPLFVLP